MDLVDGIDIQHLIKKSDQGDAKAQCDLAVIYYQGKIVSKDVVRAASLFLTSAKQRHVKAQFNLAFMYEHGYGVIQNRDEAIKYYRRSSQQGNMRATKQLAIMHETAYSLTMGFGPAAIDHSHGEGQRNMDAQNDLNRRHLTYIGCQLFDGRTVKRDLHAAMDCFRESARLGDPEAKYHIARIYAFGGKQRDLAAALIWYTRAADQEHSQSQCVLGKMYYYGDKVTKNYKKAVKLLERSATQGNTQAQMVLAEIYLNGRGVQSSEAKALRWFKLADDGGDQDAPYKLAFYKNLKHCR